MDFTDHKNLAILLKRLSTTLADKLIPHMYTMDERDSEIKRMIKILEKMPNECNQNYYIVLSKL